MAVVVAWLVQLQARSVASPLVAHRQVVRVLAGEGRGRAQKEERACRRRGPQAEKAIAGKVVDGGVSCCSVRVEGSEVGPRAWGR